MTLGPSNPDPGLLQAVPTPAGGAHTSPPHQEALEALESEGKRKMETLQNSGGELYQLAYLLPLFCSVPVGVHCEGGTL